MASTNRDPDVGKSPLLKRYAWLILMFAVALFVYGMWSWTYHLWDRREAVPGEVMRSLLEGGGWLIPASESGLIPPLYYWCSGFLVNVFGSSHAFVFRITAICSAAALVAVTGWFVARVTNRPAGILAGGITGTCAFYAWQATRMSPALTGAFLVVTGMFFLYKEITDPETNGIQSLVAFFLFGLGFLTIGPAALIPPVAIGMFVFLTGGTAHRGGAGVPWMFGTLILAVTAGVWLGPVAWFEGGAGVLGIFADPVVSFSPGGGGSEEPAWFYLESLLVHVLPWTPFLIVALPEVVRMAGNRSFLQFNLLFSTLYLILFTLLSTKDGVVFLPVIPAIASVMAIALEHRFLRSGSRLRALLLIGGCLAVVFLGAGVAAAVYGSDLLMKEIYVRPLPVPGPVTVYTISGVLFCYGLMLAGSAWKRAPRWLLGSTAAGMAVLLLVVKIVLAPNLDSRENLRAEPPPVDGVQNLSLTWEKRDMVRTMTVNFQTPRGRYGTEVRYDTASRNGRPEAYRFRREGTNRTVEKLKRTIHRTTLTGLKPDTTYYFIAGSEETGYTDEQTFRTLPESGELRFIVGGDQGTSTGFRNVNRAASKTDPHFALIGGDIAYADGNWRNTATWNAWYRIWSDTMLGKDGRLIPMVLAIGNHERNDRSKEEVEGNKYELAPFYFHYFEQGDHRGYFSKNVGDLLHVMTLDTGYVSGVTDQVDWIRNELRSHRGTRFRIALYHRPMYPAVKQVGGVEKRMRDKWEPLFNEFGVNVAFEHDGHVLKRTHRLRNGKRASDGIPYLGEGAWGMPPRTPDDSRAYLKKTAGKRHVWAVTLHRDRMDLKAIGVGGDVLDELTVRSRTNSPAGN